MLLPTIVWISECCRERFNESKCCTQLLIFNRLGGLLGNYNGEASDDLRGPGEQVVHSAAQLATQWAISPTPCYQVFLEPATTDDQFMACMIDITNI